MNKFILILPDNPEIIEKIEGRRIIIKTNNVDKTAELFETGQRKNEMFCIAVDEKKSLSDLNLSERIRKIQTALYVPELGSLKDILFRIRDFRESGIKIFMPATSQANITHIQLLSSLGVACGLYIEDDTIPVNWERINDLMYYSVYSRTNHAPIEPFAYLVDHFRPGEHTYFRSPYFENPHQFLYLDINENIALSEKDLSEGRYVGKGFETIEKIAEGEEYKRRLSEWQDYFIDNKRCAYCPAWRICHGDYLTGCEKHEQSYQFFNDLLDAAVEKYNHRDNQEYGSYNI